MATLDWPVGAGFQPRALRFGASVPKSGFGAFFTGQRQTVSHLADRLRCTITLPPCGPDDGQRREAFFLGLASTGDWVRLPHMHRSEPLGTLRGLPTVATAALAGARSLRITTTAGATMVGGDVLGTGGQLVMAAHAGAVADGSGLMVLPLVLPLVLPASVGAAVLWQAPTSTFQLMVDQLSVDYGRGRWQGALELPFLQAV